MKLTRRLTVPLCDILCINDDLTEVNSHSKIEMKRIQKKREREDREESVRPKRAKSVPRKFENFIVKEIESEESENEEDYSYKENWENKASEYERMVQKNREEKMAFLQSLKIHEVKEEFEKALKTVTPRPKPKKLCASKQHAEVLPVRKSRRLAKLDIDLSEKAIFQRAMAEEAIKIEETKTKNVKVKGSKIKKELENLEYNKLSDILPNQDNREFPLKYPFEEAISVKSDLSEFLDNFDFNVEKDTKLNLDYMSNFKNMKIGEESVAKLVPIRITSLAIHPSTDKIMVIVGSKYGHLGFWNVTSNLKPILFKPHTGGITNLKVNPYNPFQIISSSYDGTLRCGDMELKSFNQIYNVSDYTSCTYFDFVSATTLLVSQRNGYVSVLDVRNESDKKHECHDYAIKTVNVHPGNKNMFLTADNKGNMKVWDLRKLQKKSIIDVSHHKRSISSAFFSPVTGKYILTTSADDSLCIFDSSNLEEEIVFKKSIKHNNFTGRWLTPFKATWLPNSDELFSVGSMKYPRQIEIYNTSGDNVFSFTNEDYLTSVTSAVEFHPSLNLLAGGNSSGKVFIFADAQLEF